jgi:glycerol uptake facilitator-like aquaporin
VNIKALAAEFVGTFMLVASVLGAALFALFARRVWLRSLAHYTSASS